jgi:hypothetical protein
LDLGRKNQIGRRSTQMNADKENAQGETPGRMGGLASSARLVPKPDT